MSLAQNHIKITSLLLLSVLFLNGKLHQQKYPLSRFLYIVDRQRNTTLALIGILFSLSNCLRDVSVLWKMRKMSAICMMAGNDHRIHSLTMGINPEEKKILNSTKLHKITISRSGKLTLIFFIHIFKNINEPTKTFLGLSAFPLSVSGGLLEQQGLRNMVRVSFHILFLSPSNSQ